MEFLHVRHATSLLQYGGLKILVDPCLADKDAYPPIPMTPNKKRNPLVNLSTTMEALSTPDMILSTHIHNDHFDEKALEILDKEIPLFCQDTDVDKLKSHGFINLFPIKDNLDYKGLKITRVFAQHGTGPTLALMGHSSGYILSAPNEPTLYFLGDTIYIPSIKENIEKHKPELLIINAGSPKFLNSEPIVMSIQEVEKTLSINPALTFIVVHLDTFNHCMESRQLVKTYFNETILKSLGVSHFYVPEDNETLFF